MANKPTWRNAKTEKPEPGWDLLVRIEGILGEIVTIPAVHQYDPATGHFISWDGKRADDSFIKEWKYFTNGVMSTDHPLFKEALSYDRDELA